MGDIARFDWWTTVLAQYGNSEIITSILANLFESINPTTNLDDFFDLIWNVDTAVGHGLDVWGRIVGVSRTINVSEGTKYLGFEEATSVSADPFNQSPFYSGQTVTTSFELADDAYRVLIYAKALANITDGSVKSLNALLRTLFPNRGNAYVTDDGDMTMTYTFDFALTPAEAAIVTASGVLPKPVGVAATFVQNF